MMAVKTKNTIEESKRIASRIKVRSVIPVAEIDELKNPGHSRMICEWLALDKVADGEPWEVEKVSDRGAVCSTDDTGKERWDYVSDIVISILPKDHLPWSQRIHTSERQRYYAYCYDRPPHGAELLKKYDKRKVEEIGYRTFRVKGCL